MLRDAIATTDRVQASYRDTYYLARLIGDKPAELQVRALAKHIDRRVLAQALDRVDRVTAAAAAPTGSPPLASPPA